MLPTYILDSVQEVVSPVHALVYKTGPISHRDRDTTRVWKTRRAEFQDDNLVILEGFPDLHMIAIGSKQKPLAEDDFLRGICDMELGRDIPLGLVLTDLWILSNVLEKDLNRG